MKASILFGNGINRLSGDSFNWLHLLKNNLILMDEKSLLGDDIFPSDSNASVIFPLTHIYEDLVINMKCNINYDEHRGLFNEEKSVKTNIIRILEYYNLSESSNTIYKLLLNLDVENYLTTNYDMYFNDIVKKEFSVEQENSSEDIYSISTNTRYSKLHDNSSKVIWPIHGDITRFKSMILGYDHYCGNLYKIEKYIRESYDNQDVNQEYLKFREKNKGLNCPNYPMFRLKNLPEPDIFKCWIDAFFATDLHIIGLGMDLAENDIWWILNKRIRSKLYGWQGNDDYRDIIKNKIFCYGYYPPHIYNLLKAYDVDVTNAYVNKPNSNAEWIEMYRQCIKAIETNIKIRK